MDQIRDRVHVLSSCCQQLGKFFLWMQWASHMLTLIHLGMGMVIQI